jgi:NDP-sugar pyrophosphorylase family protein
VRELKKLGVRFAPVLDEKGKCLRLLDTSHLHALLPVQAVIMAGGRGERLMPLTKDLPKPMLRVGNKPIIEINIDRLSSYGISNIHVSVNYLADRIVEYFGDGASKSVSIRYLHESAPLGTMGALSLIDEFEKDYVLVMNSDLLTNIDFEAFYEKFVDSNADMIVATTPYHVKIPFAILELDDSFQVRNFREKPSYTYQSNAGIYMMKRELLSHIPKGMKFDATDMMNFVLNNNMKLVSDSILGYWLDIGSMDDFKKAQEDILHINLY